MVGFDVRVANGDAVLVRGPAVDVAMGVLIVVQEASHRKLINTSMEIRCIREDFMEFLICLPTRTFASAVIAGTPLL